MNFYRKLENSILAKQSSVCVGLDPVMARLPPHLLQKSEPLLNFLRQIIQAVLPWVAAFKPNFAYFEALGPSGMEILRQIIREIPDELVIIGDAKRGDVGHSAEMYAQAIFETFACDAVTVSPYQGYDALQPFFNYKNKGVYVLCLTSNPGADDFQRPHDLYLAVASKVQEWNKHQNCGLVVGATRPELVGGIRKVSGPMPFLIPGVGVQGGELQETLKQAHDGSHYSCLINASRSILYASSGEDFAEQAAQAAKTLCRQINACQETLIAQT